MISSEYNSYYKMTHEIFFGVFSKCPCIKGLVRQSRLVNALGVLPRIPKKQPPLSHSQRVILSKVLL